MSSQLAGPGISSGPAGGARRGRRRRWLWLVVPLAVIGVLVAVVIPAGQRAIDVLSGRQVEREIERIKAQGEPVTIRDIIPPPVPDDQNAAVLYQKAFAYLPQSGFDDNLRAFLSRDPVEEAKASRQSVKADLAMCAPAIRFLEEASRRPACRFPVQWEKGFDVTFPHLPKVGNAVCLLAARALLSAEHGDPQSALEDIATILRIADHVAAEPSITAQLVRWSCQSIALNSLNRCMHASPLSPADCESLHAPLSAVDETRSFVRAMQAQRATWVSVYSRMRAGGAWWRDTVILNLDEPIALRAWGRQVALSRRPFSDAKEGLDALCREARELPRYAAVSKLIFPCFARASASRDRAMARIGLAQWGLALRVYQVKMGRYPDSLDEVRNVVGWKLPGDVFSGKDLVYRREGRGYLLYSIGENFRDDVGMDNESWQRQWKPGKPWLPKDKRPDDIIWRMPR